MTTDSVAAESVQATSPDIASIVASVRKAFGTGRTRSVDWRKQQLSALEKLVT
jgi:aldehyde dehydrogenase (NAD+)